MQSFLQVCFKRHLHFNFNHINIITIGNKITINLPNCNNDASRLIYHLQINTLILLGSFLVPYIKDQVLRYKNSTYLRSYRVIPRKLLISILISFRRTSFMFRFLKIYLFISKVALNYEGRLFSPYFAVCISYFLFYNVGHCC